MSGPSTPGRLGVGVVGAGRVGAPLASALRAAGHAVVGASGSSPATLDRIGSLLPAVPVLDVPEVVRRAELVLLTVPDDELAPVVAGLAATGAWQAGQIVVHTAGRFGWRILEPARAAGAIPLAIHPAMTFTGTSIDVQRLVDCVFAVTAPSPVLPIGQALVVEVGGEPVVVPEESRPLYHAALAHGANHLVVLVSQAAQALEAAGVDRPGRVLEHLLTAALDGALRNEQLEPPRDGVDRGPGAIAGLTGPVVRGDVGTVREHLDVLGALPTSSAADIAPSYRVLARSAASRALAAGRIGPDTAAALLDALEAPTTGGCPVTGPLLVRDRAALAAALAERPGRRAVVMTMGALHDGHLALVERARAEADVVVVTIFVNPLQFGAGEDLDTYPRDLEGDLARLAAGGADVVFAPSPDVVYPDGDPVVRVSAGRLGEVLEGASRPGHLDGVLTVVLKLLHLTRPDVALFGRKDAQQLAAVRRMVRDLDVPVEVLGVDTVREPDGLALSSRNAYLDPTERERALVLSRALRAAEDAAREGAAAVRRAARGPLAEAESAGHLELDYLALVDPATFAEVDDAWQGAAVLAVAARIGNTRLIDNVEMMLGEEGRGR